MVCATWRNRIGSSRSRPRLQDSSERWIPTRGPDRWLRTSRTTVGAGAYKAWVWPRPRVAASHETEADGQCQDGRVASDSRMVALGFGKFARADRIFALERVTGEE